MTRTALIGRYINLDRSQDRRRAVEAQLTELGLSSYYSRFPAIDGREQPVRDDGVNPAELGCYLSHLGVVREAAGAGAWLHVVEDDIVLSRHIEMALAAVTITPDFDRYDLIFTNVRLLSGAGDLAQWRRQFDASVTTAPSGQVVSVHAMSALPLGHLDFELTTSYLVNPRSMDRVASLLAERLHSGAVIPIDKAYCEFSRSGALSAGCTVPFFSMPHLDAPSTIQGDMTAWGVSHWIMESALFADRDVEALDRHLNELTRERGVSVTSELIARAYSYLLHAD